MGEIVGRNPGAHGSKKLSALFVSKTTKPGRYADGNGLYLQISKSGSKSWIFRYMLEGKAREMGLGSVGTVSLAQARDKAVAARLVAREDGVDPIDRRKEEKRLEKLEKGSAKTFKECALELHEELKPGWKNKKHAQQWINTLEQYVFPKIGDVAVVHVDTELVLRCLKPLWVTKTETAQRVMQRIRSVLDAAKALGYRKADSANPATWAGNLDKLLAKPTKIKKVQHHPALPYQDIPEFMAKLREETGIAARALELCILTAVRSNEVRQADGAEVVTSKATWTIPADRMKMGQEHRVPLTKRALEVIEAHGPRAGALIFPGQRQGRPLSDVGLTKVLRRLGYPVITVHGFRSTFKDWASETTNFPNEVTEMALAHAIDDKTEAAYRRGDLFRKRIALMDAWAAYCARPTSQVVPIEGRRKRA